MPVPGGVTAGHVSSTVSAPGVALEMVGAESVARFADALTSLAFDQYAEAPGASQVSATTVVTAIRRSLLRRLGLMSAGLVWRAGYPTRLRGFVVQRDRRALTRVLDRKSVV